MTRVQDVLLSASEQGVFFYLKDSNLVLKAKKNALSPELKEQIRQHKAQIIQYLENTADKRQRLILPPVLPASRNQTLPLSFAQQRLWFVDQLGEGSAHYNISHRFLFQGEFRESAFEQALRTLLARHEVLRTRFVEQDGEPQQVIAEDCEPSFTRHDLSQLADEEKATEAQRLMQEQSQRPFDLQSDLMLRVAWLKLADDVHLIVYTMHHIVSDAWSRVILQRELSVLYAAYCKGEPNPLPPLAIQYADYAVWQRQWLEGEVLDHGLSYWKKQLADLPSVHSLPLDGQRPAKQRYRGKIHRQSIGPKLAAGIAELNRRNNTTLFMFMHTAFALLLSRWSGERDIVVGGAITGRTHRDVEGLIGFFINDLVLRMRIHGAPGFIDLLKQHRETILDAYAHQHIPFEMLVEEINPERSMSYSPLHQIKLDVQNNEEAKVSLVDLELLNGRVEAEVRSRLAQQEQQSQQLQSELSVRHDLYVSVSEQPNGLSLTWRYNTDLFTPETIARWSAHFETLLEGIVAAPNESVYRLPLLTDAQQQSLLLAGRGPQVTYPQGKCLHELFEEQVERGPDATAVVARDGTLTFRQLNEQANQLAHYLLTHGVSPGSRVALCVERSVDMLVGLLGILKAGGAYLPLDPAHPPARLQYMLEDSGCRWVLTQGELMSSVSWGERGVLPIDAPLRATLLKDYAQHNPALKGCGLTSHHLAYVIYTSGSTGQPKGVMVEHEGVVRYCDYACQRYYGPDLAGSLVATSYGFDLTVPALYVPLLAGGHVRLLEEGRELEELAEILVNAPRPYLLRVTPSHLTGMLPLLAGKRSTCTHALVIGGEALPVAVVQALRACLPRAMFYNHYGPTESIVGCSLLALAEEEEQSSGYYPIGTALGHKQLLVLNGEMQLQPAGTPGQLHVGGDALSRGYLGQPALTAQKFSSNPFSKHAGARLYATGDLARWRADGNLEFLGRIDQQVKLRGLRIELGEIEHEILLLPGVRECAVTVIGAAENQRLVAYVVAEEDPTKDAEDDAALVRRKERLIEGYREGLGSRLPVYMVPQVYVFLPRLPLTLHGKLDREALPAPEEGDLIRSRYVAPRNATEQKLCTLWQEVLKVDRVGIEDNFFLLGGHSLLATRLVNLIRQEFATELPLRALFEAPTVVALADKLGDAPEDFTLPPVTVVPRDQPLPLSYAQQRLWFIDQLGEGSAQYNITDRYFLQGKFHERAFELALRTLVDRHEVLRTHFATVNGEAQQVIVKDYALPFTRHDLSKMPANEKVAEAQRLMREEATCPFDLSADLMVRVRWLKLSSDQHLILYTMHHIASDGWSKEILQNELGALYEAYGKGLPNPLKPLKIQYADYAVWQRQWLQGEVLEKQLTYWRKQLSGIPVLHALPLDYPRPARQTFEGRRVPRLLGKDLTKRIRALCEAREVTLFMFLQTAFAVLLGRFSNATDIVMGSPMAGRTHKDVEGVIGFFINTLVLRTDLSNNPTFGELLEANKRVILDAYANQHIPFDMLVDELNPERSLSHYPLTQIIFVVQNNEKGTFGQKTQLAGASRDDATETLAKSGGSRNVPADLALYVTEVNDVLALGWLYKEALFRGETIERLAASFEVLLNSILATCEKGSERKKVDSDRGAGRADGSRRPHEARVLETHIAISPRPTAALVPASEGQVREWRQSRSKDTGGRSGNITHCWRLQGTLDVKLLGRSLQQIVSRHETLRTHFEERNGSLWSVASPPGEVGVAEETVESKIEISGIREAEQRFAFDLSQGNLWRIRLLREATDSNILMLTMHRSIADEYSAEIFIHELADIYRRFMRGRAPPADLTLQYADCAYWQKRWLEEGKFDHQMTYWRAQLANLPILKLPTRRPRMEVSDRGTRRTHIIPSGLSVRVLRLAKSCGVSFPTALMSVLGMVLSTYSRQYQFAIATRTANRRERGTQQLIAPLGNTLLLKMDLRGDPRLSEVLRSTQETVTQAHSNQDLPFEKVYENHTSPCPVLFALHNPRIPRSPPNLAIATATSGRYGFGGRYGFDGETRCEHDLSIVMSESRIGMVATVEYKTELFDSEFIERMLCNYERFLSRLVENPGGRLSSLESIESRVWSLDILEREERRRLLQINPDRQAGPRCEKSADELFLEAVEAHPDAIALTLDEAHLTYEELNRRSSILARFLQRQGVGSDVRVGVCMERSIEMIVSLLGILKAGGCYVPLDPSYPTERLRYLLDDAAPALLLTHTDVLDWLPECAARLVALDAAWGEIVKGSEANAGADPLRSSSWNLAYLIYTSGSTGQPKGVMVEQASASNLAAQHAAFGITVGSRVLQFASPSFDGSIWECLMALCGGASLQLASGEQLLPGPELTKLLVEKEITHLVLPPSALRVLSSEALEGRLQTLIVAGEACPADLVSRWAPGRMFVNGYGPTEATVVATWHRCDATQGGVPPIGSPFANTRIYIVDRHLRPVPVGVVGEIYVAGAGVARGYLNRRALTAERFVPDPFVEDDGARMYCTGDLGRWRVEGTVEFLGRADDQVKLRGYRIELKEIEQRLLDLPGVRECAVTISGTAEEQRLIAYVVPDHDPTTGAEDDATVIQRKKRLIEGYRKGLDSRLPAYMVPQVYVFMPRLPFTVNGKLDLKALPAPEEGDMQTSRYVAPRNATEEKLCALWRELLKVPRVGIEDNFFLLGGHSLLAARLLNLVRETFGAELPLRVLFESPTIAALSEQLSAALETSTLPPLMRVPRDQPLPLSYAQQRLWFIDQLGEGSAQYNAPGSYLLDGELNVGAFERALQSLLERHEALRTHFVCEREAGEPRQVIAETFALPFQLHDLSGLSEQERAHEAQRLMREEAGTPFDLSRDLMVRVRVLKLSDQRHLILYTLHHIAGDGWSFGIFKSELSALYRAYRSGAKNPLKPLKIQYADYASWQRGWLRGEVLERELAYWKEQLSGIPPVHALPLDHPRPALQSFEARAFRQVLNRTTAARIKALCERHEVTLFMFLETAFAVLLARYCNETDVVIATPIAGRTHKDVEGLIGFFVNSLVLRLDLSGSPSFGELLQKNRQVILDAYDHQHLPFDVLVEKIRPDRRLNYNPLVQIMFAVQNNERGQLDFQTQEQEGAEPLEARGNLIIDEKRTRLDLEVYVNERADALSISWVYNKSLFDDESIARLARNYEMLLQSAMVSLAVESSDRCSFDRLGLISEAEQNVVLHEWNATAASFPREKCAHQLFEEQAREKPDTVALVYAGQQVTYAELNHRANSLANFLARKGIGPNVLVGVCLERSIELVVSLLGIWKAGGCYVPLDPNYPAERLHYMLQDTAPALLLTRSDVQDQLPECAAECVALDAAWDEIAECSAADPDPCRSSARDLAYVVYTSGSTGQPKGVMVEQASASNLAAQHAAFGITVGSRVLQFASPNFDGSIWEYVMALCSGASLQLAFGEQLLPSPELTKLLVEKEITHLVLPPSALRVLSAEALEGRLQTLVVAGEACPADLVSRWAPGRMFVNGYGPTEATVVATWHRCDATLDEAPPIGSPFANTRIYIVDPHLRPAPIGVLGEIYVAGAGVARGYLNRRALTAERFVPDPFVEDDGARMYRTGDLGRWRADGTIEFVGRTDNQVKVRGYRIELGEIERTLGTCAQLSNAAVSLDSRPGMEPELIAYVSPTARFLDSLADELDHEQVLQRSSLIDTTYEKEQGRQLADPDFGGFHSSYTGEPIDREQMCEWLDGTVGLLEGLRPKRLLEIGCRTGLLLFRYGAHCEAVDALDISAEVLGGVRGELERRGWAHVRLGQGDALSGDVFGDTRYDTVLLNSVVQSFPSRQYLEKVIVRSLGRLADGGRILLGDVRSLDLFEAHAAAVERSGLRESTAVSVVARRVQRRLQKEPELLISPSYFARLPERYAEIGRVDILVKRGLGDNELLKYRYEVVLTKGRTEPAKGLRWTRFDGFEHLGGSLSTGEQSFGVWGVPNGRVEDDVSLSERLAHWAGSDLMHPPAEAGRLSTAGLDRVRTLESILRQAEAKGYRVAVTWSADRLDQVDVLFSRGDLPPVQPHTAYANGRWTNYPQLGLAGHRLSEELPKYLEERLPEYMVPRVYIALERLPQTGFGKVDRKVLPAPEEGDWLKSSYVAPRNATEEKLCALWQDLLKIGRVGIEDNFFMLGGHSLLAARLANLIRQAFAIELPLRALFEAPTIAALSERIGTARETLILPSVTPVPRDQPLPLSFSQQRLWFIDQLAEGSTHYNLPGHFILRGEFQEDAFRQALKTLIDRHEVLRTYFATVDGEVRQIIMEDYDLPFTRHDLSALPDEEKTAEVQRLMREQLACPFDLGADVMLRMQWLRLADDLHLIAHVKHHIVYDHTSGPILQRELSVLYAAYCKGEPNPLPPLSIQYADYAVWQRQWLQGEVLEQGLSYWKRQLADLPSVHSLPLDKPRPAQQRHRGSGYRLLIGPKLAAGIAELNRKHNTTLFMFMHTAFALLLSRWSGERDIVVGGAITSRAHRDVDGLIGFFINDLVLRMQLRGTPNFTELLKQHRETILDAFAHQHIPFEMLAEELNPVRSLRYDPLYQIKLDVDHGEQVDLVDLESPHVDVQRRPARSQHELNVRHDLHVAVSEQQGGLLVGWAFKTDLFAPETIARWSAHFETLLEGIVAAPDESVYRLPLLTKAEQQSLLLAGQGPQVAYPQGKCLHELFEAQVERSPDEAAVVARNGTLSFRQLNRAANRLAHYLLAHGVGPGSRVALCTERSMDMVVGLLGILKSGGAYVPLDPAHPPARLQYMLEDSGCRWVLTQGELMSAVSVGDRQVLPIDASLRATLLKDYPEHNPALEGQGMNARQLAYVIYTSGSTGQPKGVMVEHEGVVRYCDHARERYYGSDLAGSLVATSYGFDLTVPGLYLPLLAGGHVRLLEEGRELEELAEVLVHASQPYLLRVTPSHLTGVLPLLADRRSTCAHALVIGGEALSVSMVQAVRAALPQARIYNHYGPTESIVGCSLLPMAQSADQSWNCGYCPIGTALGHKQLLVLNTEMQLQPVGTPGQLHVGGDALARGYLGQPALTAQKFSSNPFSESAGARLYATGDRVRWRADGNLEFLGRLDQQVKIRGLRIELGEIEQALLELTGMRECAVTVSGAGEEQRLVAYVVPEEDPAKDAEDDAALIQRKERLIEGYRAGLGSRLPAYMVPQVYVFLPRLPLTLNGKLDREALPTPAESDLVKARYVAPMTATEEKLCALWQEVLKVGRVGIEDDFFLLGGHSLLAARLVKLIRQEFATELPLRALFESPTVAQMAVSLDRTPQAAQETIKNESAPARKCRVNESFHRDVTEGERRSDGEACSDVGYAQDTTRMDHLVRTYVDTKRFMGSVLVARGDQVLLSKGYGEANLEWHVANTATTKFRLGSITKQFTAASILLLEERGKLKVGDPLEKYMLDAPATWNAITLEHLLTHTSGIPKVNRLPGFQKRKVHTTKVEEAIGWLRDQPLDFAPGERMAYSNSGYLLLGFVIEKVSGQSYAQFVQENIFTPLGMTDSGYDSNSAIIERRAAGYTPRPGGIVNADYVNMTIPHAAGALYSTTEDLLRWHCGLYGNKLLSVDAVRRMTTPFKGGHGFGLAILGGKRRTYQHGGAIEGFNTQLTYYPDSGITVAALANLNGSAPGEIVEKLGRLAHGDSILLTSERQELTLSREQLQRYVGTYSLAPNVDIMVTASDAQLYVQLSGQPKFPAYAESDRRFFLEVVDAQFEFFPETGAVTHVILFQNGFEQEATRTSDTVLQLEEGVIE